MRYKLLAIFLSVCMLFLLASCGKTSKETSSKNVKKESTTQTTKAKVLTKEEKEEQDIKWRNYYNDRIAEDKEYTYYIDAYGVNKISKSDNKVEKLTNKDFSKRNLGFFLAKHNDYIYFVTSQGLCRIGTDGKNYYKFKDIPTSNNIVKCVNDRLYIHARENIKEKSHIFCYDIKDDPDEPKLISNDVKEFLAPDGNTYYVEDIEVIGNNLFLKNKKTKIKLLSHTDKIIIYENKFYYSNSDHKIMQSDKDGKNIEELYYLNDYNLEYMTFDGTWIYLSVVKSSVSKKDNSLKFDQDLIRINTITKEIKIVKNFGVREKNVTPYFDISDKYIYYWDAGRMKQISNDSTGKAIFVKP